MEQKTLEASLGNGFVIHLINFLNGNIETKNHDQLVDLYTYFTRSLLNYLQTEDLDSQLVKELLSQVNIAFFDYISE